MQGEKKLKEKKKKKSASRQAQNPRKTTTLISLVVNSLTGLNNTGWSWTVWEAMQGKGFLAVGAAAWFVWAQLAPSPPFQALTVLVGLYHLLEHNPEVALKWW